MDNIFVAEMVGTAILILLGDGVVANVLLKDSKGEGSGWIVITVGWGFAVMMGVFAANIYSGAHLNPAVTIGLAVGDLTPWEDVPQYLAGEFAGAFIGAILVYLAYSNHWAGTEDPGLKLAVFSTGPAHRNTGANVMTEVIGTAMLLIGVLAIVGTTAVAGEQGMVGLGTGLNPLFIGFLVWGIGLSLGGPTGYAINPARDLSPRIAHAVLPIPGKGDSDWNYAWIPVVGPIIGGILGVLLFNWLVPG